MAVRKTPTIPVSEANLIEVAKNASKAWTKHPEYNLLWTNPEKFETSIDLFENSFVGRQSAKGARSVITSELQTVNAEINSNLKYVKNYIIDLYSKKDAPAYYPQFGIAKMNGRYVIPRDNDERLYALRQLVEAMKQVGFADQKYGNVYWQNIFVRFEATKNDAINKDSASSRYINVKEEQKALIRQTLSSLILMIKANNFTNWREELRVWGFQKEEY
jgi:hypothetical protein